MRRRGLRAGEIAIGEARSSRRAKREQDAEDPPRREHGRNHVPVEPRRPCERVEDRVPLPRFEIHDAPVVHCDVLREDRAADGIVSGAELERRGYEPRRAAVREAGARIGGKTTGRPERHRGRGDVEQRGQRACDRRAERARAPGRRQVVDPCAIPRRRRTNRPPHDGPRYPMTAAPIERRVVAALRDACSTRRCRRWRSGAARHGASRPPSHQKLASSTPLGFASRRLPILPRALRTGRASRGAPWDDRPIGGELSMASSLGRRGRTSPWRHFTSSESSASASSS